MPEKVSLLIPEEVYKKIRYTCDRITEDEWSGTLLYKVEGDIDDIKNFKLEVKDFIVQDKGDKTSTGFTHNVKRGDVNEDRVMDYFNENPEALDYRMGLIHSHNTMSVYFSGVDEEELEDNAGSHNFYLSLIINNRMEFCARVAQEIVSEHEIDMTYNRRNVFGKLINFITEKKTITSKKIIYYECDITSQSVEPELDDFFVKNLNDVINSSRNTYTPYGTNYGGHGIYGNWSQKSFNGGQRSKNSISNPKMNPIKKHKPSRFKESVDELFEAVFRQIALQYGVEDAKEVFQYLDAFNFSGMESEELFLEWIDIYNIEFKDYFSQDKKLSVCEHITAKLKEMDINQQGLVQEFIEMFNNHQKFARV